MKKLFDQVLTAGQRLGHQISGWLAQSWKDLEELGYPHCPKCQTRAEVLSWRPPIVLDIESQAFETECRCPNCQHFFTDLQVVDSSPSYN